MMIGNWDDPAAAASNMQWVKTGWAKVEPLTDGFYVNEIAHDDPANKVRGTYGDNYPRLRDHLIASQKPDGSWVDETRRQGQPGKLFATSVACFVLAIPNRYLPILQEGKIESMKKPK